MRNPFRPKPLDQWFRAKREEQENAVLLESSLLADTMGKYFGYRLRFFLLRALIVIAIHYVEIRVLLAAFQVDDLFRAVSAKTLTFALSAGWWAALEVMRGEIRSHKRNEKPYLIPRTILAWLTLARRASMGLTAALAIGAVALSAFGHWTPMRFYALACGLRLAAEIWMRVYHSGVYATRRIYRPLHWILLIEFASLLLFFELRTVMGSWALGCVTLLTCFFNNLLSFRYVHRMYAFIGYQKSFADIRKRRTRVYPVRDLRRLLPPAVAMVVFKLDALLILILTLGGTRLRDADFFLFLTLVLAAPLLQASQEWGQLIYFDFKKLELESFTNLRRRFLARLRWLPFFLGGALWLPLPIMAWTLMPPERVPATLTFALILLPHAFLSLEVVRAFSDGLYAALTRAGAILLGGCLLASYLLARAQPTYFLCALSALVTVAYLWLRRLNRAAAHGPSARHALPLLDWTRMLRDERGPAAGAVIVLKEEESGWRTQRFTEKILRALRHDRVRACMLSDTTVLISLAPSAGDLRELLVLLGAGWIERLHVCAGRDTGPAVLDELAAATPYLAQLARMGRRASIEGASIAAQFKEHFGDKGRALDLAHPSVNSVAGLEPEDRREILAGGLRFLKKLPRKPEAGSSWDVTALGAEGSLEHLFAVPNEPRTAWKRFRWRLWVSAANFSRARGTPRAKPDVSLHN
jgi:hypothetical protein